MSGAHARAILWAQGRALANYYFRRNRGIWFVVSALFVVIWYGMWAFGAVAVAIAAAAPESMDTLRSVLAPGLLLVVCYWQIVPMIMVSTGLSLDLARLLVYPVPHVQLFGIEVLLRVSTAIEMIFISAGLCIGLALNPRIPWWAPLLSLVPFTVFNLLLSAGMRELFTRLMARKYFREGLVFLLVLIAALPQVLIGLEGPQAFGWLGPIVRAGWWPWSATASIGQGAAGLMPVAILFAWTGFAWIFGRRQFERSLRFDAAAARASASPARARSSIVETLSRLPNILLRDPLAALIEKEIRFLCRAPRFRLLFLMGFSFGLLIWLPLTMRGDPESTLRTNYLTVVSAYALMLMGEVAFWNNFGMDRMAAQMYFVTPLRISTVLAAKNLASALFIGLEIGIVALFCLVLQMPVTPGNVAEALGVTAVMSMYLFAIGNMLSVRYAKGVDPSQSWRTGNVGRVQAYLLLVYPLVMGPVFLAYGARYAFEEDLAFWGVILLDLAIGAIVYSISLESAAATALGRREDLVQSLSGREGPIGG